jgi:hypothetical protein
MVDDVKQVLVGQNQIEAMAPTVVSAADDKDNWIQSRQNRHTQLSAGCPG